MEKVIVKTDKLCYITKMRQLVIRDFLEEKVNILHSVGFRFIPKEGWIVYDYSREKLKRTHPELIPYTSDGSITQSVLSKVIKSRISPLEDQVYKQWILLDESMSLRNLLFAKANYEKNVKDILKKITKDFNLKNIFFGLNYKNSYPYSENNKIHIYSYRGIEESVSHMYLMNFIREIAKMNREEFLEIVRENKDFRFYCNISSFKDFDQINRLMEHYLLEPPFYIEEDFLQWEDSKDVSLTFEEIKELLKEKDQLLTELLNN